jgi:DNA-binding CsgD family transcriptional regulator
MPKLNMEKINRHLLAPLSDREFEIAQLVYEGITNTQIADKIYISINTIKSHLKSIHLKLDASSRLQVIGRLRELMLK